jgi:hypothetical protein
VKRKAATKMEMKNQKPPQRVEAPAAEKGKNEATFIFLHGYGDDADGWTSKLIHAHLLRIVSKFPELAEIRMGQSNGVSCHPHPLGSKISSFSLIALRFCLAKFSSCV